jgi:hypothetical protein
MLVGLGGEEHILRCGLSSGLKSGSKEHPPSSFDEANFDDDVRSLREPSVP